MALLGKTIADPSLDDSLPKDLDICKYRPLHSLVMKGEPGTRPKFYKKTAARTNRVGLWSPQLSSITPPSWTKAEISKLCNVCASLDLHKLLFSVKPNHEYGPMFGEELEHHRSSADLIVAAKAGCELCKAVWVSDKMHPSRHKYDVGEDRGVDFGLVDTTVWCSVSRGGLIGNGDSLNFKQKRLEWYRCLNMSFEYFTYDSKSTCFGKKHNSKLSS